VSESDAAGGVGTWPSCAWEQRPWRQSVRGGTREDRVFSEITTIIPPKISDVEFALPAELGGVLDVALREITSLDNAHGPVLHALGTLLLRTEAVASSKIEHIEASMDDYARAMFGSRQNESAMSMVSATHAFEGFLDSVQADPITLVAVKEAHRKLMEGDPRERSYAGRFRDVQNWVGGSDFSPRGAIFVPPAPETVDPLMDDLETFVNRDDLSILFQAAIAHAQFETIHPFTDGNGRIGRALINVILRRRQATTRVVVPLASALVVKRDNYFALLESYRDGDPLAIVHSFALAATLVVREARKTASELEAIPARWRASVSRLRTGGSTERILDHLLAVPVVTAESLVRAIGVSPSSVYSALERLAEANVIRPLTDRTRNQVWGASAVLEELDDLQIRIAIAARAAG
jgi:Fic family protein